MFSKIAIVHLLVGVSLAASVKPHQKPTFEQVKNMTRPKEEAF